GPCALLASERKTRMPEIKKNKLTPIRPAPLTRFVKKKPWEIRTRSKAKPRHWSKAADPRADLSLASSGGAASCVGRRAVVGSNISRSLERIPFRAKG